MFTKYINTNKNNMLDSICNLISIPSISIETNNYKYPFGKECNTVLKEFLLIASSLGFRVKNIDNYCGYAEFGDGKEIIGIIGHLDVVPAKEEDWEHSPFIPTIEGNYLFGRGAIDDKGPVIASLYAMKAVMDYCNDNKINVNKRVRLIVGLNEEKNWKCIEYYKTHEELPTIGFSPDAEFPCIHAEKGVLSLSLSDKLDSRLPISILDIDCANNALNVVPKYASATIKINFNNINMNSLIDHLKNTIEINKYEIDIYKIDNKTIKLTSYGVSSHSAHPELGNNAITKLLIIINEIYTFYKIKFPFLSTFCKYIGDNYLGTNLKIDIKDESGHLTLNTSQTYIKDNKLFISMNLRIPVHTDLNTILNAFNKTFKDFNVNTIRWQEPLFISKDKEIVNTLCDIYNEECKTDYKPIAIGGATYARAFNNCISFGMNFPGDEDMCHKEDEYIRIDKLILSANIYAKAIYKLLQ